MAHRRRSRDSFTCPHCGADVSAGAPACRECGSDAETGWSDDVHVWSANIPAGYDEEDDFDYDAFVAREFPDQVSTKLDIKKLAMAVVVAILCLALLLWTIGFP
jgi:hypothetical protein